MTLARSEPKQQCLSQAEGKAETVRLLTNNHRPESGVLQIDYRRSLEDMEELKKQPSSA